MYTIARKVGRLVEIRVAPPVTVAEVASFGDELHRMVDGMFDRFVSCADFSHIHIFPPEVVGAYATCMKRLNARLGRTGILITRSATFELQVGRIIKEAGNDQRQIFSDSTALQSWLGEVLTIPEQVRLKEFLSAL